MKRGFDTKARATEAVAGTKEHEEEENSQWDRKDIT